jgi:hypothetical protein
MKSLYCWKCGAEVRDEPLPLSRMAECPACRAQLHVCRMCAFFDSSVANSCREPVADPVTDKERANFCGYLQPSTTAWRPADTEQARRSELELAALFGGQAQTGEEKEPDHTRNELDSLFGGKTGKD